VRERRESERKRKWEGRKGKGRRRRRERRKGECASPSNTWFVWSTEVCLSNGILIGSTVFWATVCKTVALCYRTVVLSVCNVGVLWPNGWTDHDETWHAGRPWPWPHIIVLHGDPSPPPLKGHSPQFLAHICCGQMAAWIKIPLGPCDFVLDGNPPPLPKKGAKRSHPIFGPCLLWPNGWMEQDGT